MHQLRGNEPTLGLNRVLFNNIVDLVHLTLNDLHYYHYGPSGTLYYLSSYLTSDKVEDGELCLFDWYKEFCRPLLGYFLHIFLNELIINLHLLLVFIPTCSDIYEMSICVKLRDRYVLV